MVKAFKPIGKHIHKSCPLQLMYIDWLNRNEKEQIKLLPGVSTMTCWLSK